GFLCALTSVAGDRGRPRNHAYGSTKAAVTAYLEGLRARLSREGLSVVNVEPGVVDTGMTWGLPPGPPKASAERVARDVLRGIARDRAVVYTPWLWRWVMAIIRCLPDRVFRRLDL
ncbi:MAG TPA: SDR family NAD(P)-dependent oxidoreductase, partial [Planctomycetota bacterium]|nr:SDR family NAD(P)-dependent oxidoreductase [Planctomycetota bacterium]